MTTETQLLKTTPKASGATELACDIANRIANLDGLSPHIDDAFLAAIARAITSEIDSRLPALLSVNETGLDAAVRAVVEPPRITAIDRVISCGSCALTGLFNDGSTKKLFSYYIDELTICDAHLIGLTEDEAHQLRQSQDSAYLRS